MLIMFKNQCIIKYQILIKFCAEEQKKKVRETFTSKSFSQKLNNSGVGLKVPKILEYLQ